MDPRQMQQLVTRLQDLEHRLGALERRMNALEDITVGFSGSGTGRAPRRSNREGSAPSGTVGTRGNAMWLPFTIEAIAHRHQTKPAGDNRQWYVKLS